jgi:capsular polysaccharide biosynthesis protein
MEKEMELEIDIGQCIKAIGKNIWLVILTTLVIGLIGIAVTLQPTVIEYSAVSTIYSAAAGSYTDSQQGAAAMQDYIDIASSLKVCESAAAILGNPDITGEYIMESITTSITEDSYIMSIEAVSTDPQLAMQISTALANAFVVEMQTITGGDKVQILDEAYDYDVAYDSGVLFNRIRLGAAAGGFLLSCLVISLLTIFNPRAITLSECSLGDQLEIIGVIPRNNQKKGKKS